MANIKSQIKRNRQNEKRRIRNRIFRGAARSAVKDARTQLATGSVDDSRSAVLAAISLLDKAAEKGVLHRNNAARRKSRLMKHLATLSSGGVVRLQAEPGKPRAPRVEPKAKVEVKPAAEAAPAPKVEEKKKPAPKKEAKAEPKAKATKEKETKAKKTAKK